MDFLSALESAFFRGITIRVRRGGRKGKHFFYRLEHNGRETVGEVINDIANMLTYSNLAKALPNVSLCVSSISLQYVRYVL